MAWIAKKISLSVINPVEKDLGDLFHGGIGFVMKVAFHTLGCKLNQFESDSLASLFRSAGYQIVPFNAGADIYIINTCTVTHKSDRKSRNMIGHVATKMPKPLLVVTGCYADSDQKKLEEKFSIDYLVPNKKKNLIFSLVDAHVRNEVNPVGQPDVFDFQSHGRVNHTRAFLKIQDGCDNGCSYCIIPSVRGAAVSRPLNKVIEAATIFVRSGAKELVLSGINIGHYESGASQLSELIGELIKIEGDFRIRISSLEPETLTPPLVDLFHHPKLCNHLHLCLQSGSDEILKKMKRPYDRGQFLKLVTELRRSFPDFNLTTDMIVGFPGERDEDFQDSLQSIEYFGFSQVHVFKYSPRATTVAADLPHQIPEIVKTQRSKELQQKTNEAYRHFLQKQVGKKVRVLVEKKDGDLCWGWSDEYLPVRFASMTTQKNCFALVHLKEVRTKDSDQEMHGKEELWGEII